MMLHSAESETVISTFLDLYLFYMPFKGKVTNFFNKIEQLYKNV